MASGGLRWERLGHIKEVSEGSVIIEVGVLRSDLGIGSRAYSLIGVFGQWSGDFLHDEVYE